MEKRPSKAQGLSHKLQPSITVALNWGHKALAQLVTDWTILSHWTIGPCV